MITPLAERFEGLYEPEPNTGCWLWIGTLCGGYGYLSLGGGVSRGAHRIAYELYKGPIPDRLQLDHLCRVRSCVNPRHLEAVTQKTNLHRGETIAARNRAKTHCPRGHEYTPRKTRLGIFRYCDPCTAAWKREHRQGVPR